MADYRIELIAVPVSDVNRARAFYGDTLGWPVDHDQTVQIWNASSHELWGLRAEEVEGKNLFSLDVGLPVKDLEDPILRALSPQTQGSSSIALDAVNRRGRAMRVNVSVMPLVAAADQHFGALILVTPEGVHPTAES